MRDTMRNANLPEPKFDKPKTELALHRLKVTLRNNVKQRKVWLDTDVSIALVDAPAKNLLPQESES